MGFQMALIVIRAAVVLCGEIICLMMLIPRMRKLLVLRRSMLFDVPDRGQSRQIPSGNAGTSTTKSEEEKVSASKPVARAQAKVPFEKGYSQMDWLKLTQKHHDLAGVDILLKALGKDCTSLFNNYHAWVNAEFLLEKCLVGTSDASQRRQLCLAFHKWALATSA